MGIFADLHVIPGNVFLPVGKFNFGGKPGRFFV